MRIKFLRDELFENVGRKQGHTFKKGETYDVTDEFGERWLRRGAVDVISGGKGKVIDAPFALVKGARGEKAEPAVAAAPPAPPAATEDE